MTLRNSIFAVSGAASFLDARRDMAGLFVCDANGNPVAGVLDGPDVLVSGVSSGMKLTVAPFQAVLSRYGALLISSDGDYTLSLSVAPSANSRIDAVYVKQNEKDSPMSDASNGPVIGVVTGSAATTPQAPSIPSGALLLAYVTIPAGVSNTTASGVVIQQKFPRAAVKGGVPAVRTVSDLNALNMRDYSTVKVLADNVEYVRKDGAWTPHFVGADLSSYFTIQYPVYWNAVWKFIVTGDIGTMNIKVTRLDHEWSASAWTSDIILRLSDNAPFTLGGDYNFPAIANSTPNPWCLGLQASTKVVSIRSWNTTSTLQKGGWLTGSFNTLLKFNT